VIARDVNLETVGKTTRQELPDVALVGLGVDPAHALDMISNIVHEAACPVIALLDFDDPAYVNEAAKRGVFAYMVTEGEAGELQSALDTLRRFAEYQLQRRSSDDRLASTARGQPLVPTAPRGS
jgi:DNA-binding NarL/FixJ family response regulator